jgi:hypothetical protein
MELFHGRNVPYIWSSKFNNTFSQKPEIWLGVNWQDVPKTVLQQLLFKYSMKQNQEDQMYHWKWLVLFIQITSNNAGFLGFEIYFSDITL